MVLYSTEPNCSPACRRGDSFGCVVVISTPSPRLWKHSKTLFISLAWNEEHPHSHTPAYEGKWSQSPTEEVQWSGYCGLWGHIEEVRELNSPEPLACNYCAPQFISSKPTENQQGRGNTPLFTALPRGKSNDLGEKVLVSGSGRGQS